jgi:hypothetical protein
MMTSTDNSKIIEIAALKRRIDQSESADDKAQLGDELSDELSRLDGIEQKIVDIVCTVLSGERCSITSTDLRTIDRCHSLANDLGATVEDGTTTGNYAVDLNPDGRSAPARMSITIVPKDSA